MDLIEEQRNVWQQLKPSEQIAALVYCAVRDNGEFVPKGLFTLINKLHGKYPDFSVYCVPSEK